MAFLLAIQITIPCSHKVCIFLSGSFGFCGYKPFGCGFEQEDQREIPPNRLEERSGSDRNAMEDFILIIWQFFRSLVTACENIQFQFS